MTRPHAGNSGYPFLRFWDYHRAEPPKPRVPASTCHGMPPMFAGGQGRSAADVQSAGVAGLLCGTVALIVVVYAVAPALFWLAASPGALFAWAQIRGKR